MSDYNLSGSKCNTSNGTLEAAHGGKRSAERSESRYISEVTNPLFELVDHNTGEISNLGAVSRSVKINEARRIRLRLQSASRNTLYGFHTETQFKLNGSAKHHRTCYCNYVPTSKSVNILKSIEHGKAHFSGVATCANSRTCPVCSGVINERKSNEMRIAFNQAKAMKLHVSMFTFTAPHSYTDNPKDLVPKILAALSEFWRGKSITNWKKRTGYIGNIRSFEIRFGRNGCHPHFHIIVFSSEKMPYTRRVGRKVLDMDLQSDGWQWIAKRWIAACSKVGLKRPNEYGVDIQNGQMAGEYITKFGSDDEILTTKKGKALTWDMADEMTKGNTKRGRNGSLSPWDLLEMTITGTTADIRKKAKLDFLDYARAMQGVTLVKWSRGLRDFFQLEKELSDSEILSAQDDNAQFLADLTIEEWKYIIKNDLRAVVLELAENGGVNAVANFCLGIKGCTNDKQAKKFKKDFTQRLSGRGIEDTQTQPRSIVATDNNYDFVLSDTVAPNTQYDFTFDAVNSGNSTRTEFVTDHNRLDELEHAQIARMFKQPKQLTDAIPVYAAAKRVQEKRNKRKSQ